MQRLQAFKFELMPNGEQQRNMRRFDGACRFIFNRALALQKARHENGESKLSYAGLCTLLVEWKANSDTKWLALTPSQALQQSLKDLDRSYTNFFAKRARFPRFKKKGQGDRFRFPQGVTVDQANSRIRLPKLGWIRYRNSRAVLGALKNATVSQVGDKWYVSIQTEREVEMPVSTALTGTRRDWRGDRRAGLRSSSAGVGFPWLAGFRRADRRVLAHGREAVMVKRVLIIGGYGNFGSYVAQALAVDERVRLLIGGRSEAKATAFVARLKPHHLAEPARIDISGDVTADLAHAAPDIVVHTTVPFQGQTYAVARACIEQGCHYIDLADAREFVAGIGTLDSEAKARDLLIGSGASSVPCLTAAIIDHYAPDFTRLDSVDYGISAAQQTNRGLATTSAILSYVGKAFSARRDGRTRRLYGWQELHSERYPELGRRWFGNCDVPDLALFPNRYPQLKTQRFCAGHEIAALHFGLWLLS
jgi:hypothetical protein